jgi:HEAT repeat protein
MPKQLIAALLGILLSPLCSFAQEADGPLEQWRDVLRFGIESQVTETLEIMTDEREERLAGLVAELLETSLSNAVREAAFQYFEAVEDGRAIPAAVESISNPLDASTSLLLAATRYMERLADEVGREGRQALLDLAERDDGQASVAAVDALAEMELDEETIAYLIDLYDESGRVLREALILAFGELEAESTEPLLLDILRDETAESSLRWYAADSLGKMQAAEAVPLLRDLLGSEETILRAYATAALSRYEDENVNEVLIQALRDSFWRVREAAADGLGRRTYEDAVPALSFMARRDPDRRVRQAALGALSEIGNAEAVETLEEIYADPRAPLEYRLTTARLLVSEHFNEARDTIERVLAEEWDEEDSRVLDATADELSRLDASGVGDLYSRMLNHPNFVIRIYAARGIATNGLSRFREDLQSLTGEEQPSALRRNAEAALERMGGVPASD